ncbi:hypothetical protein X777_05196 [Ooceraea biroi]|uniref:Uncharacterized protein n=1 Tax=Ooceraea biroi TaxID=2015173 RepID=A0A026WHW8_OOCBI|nr:hypothetical protein X777_05196 [Ooceraea biroi]
MLFRSAEAIASAFSPESRSFAFTRTTDVPAGSFSDGLVFGQVSHPLTVHHRHQRCSSTASISPPPPPLPPSLPVALTRTLAICIDAGHHCYKCCPFFHPALPPLPTIAIQPSWIEASLLPRNASSLLQTGFF